MRDIKSIISYHGTHYFFAIIYAVGLLLFFVPITRDLFILATPYTLVLTATLVFYYHKKWDIKTLSVLSMIFVSSILIENIGVATGEIFGVYSYGTGLGFKIEHVPVLIGLNWVILVYGSNGILSKLSSNRYIRVIGASVLMLAYDFLLEFAAPPMKMWEFTPINPPIQNYLMWFVLALVFNGALELLNISTKNRPGRTLFIIQMIFFLFVAIGTSILEG